MIKNLIQIKSGIMINVNVSEKKHLCEEHYIWNSATCSTCSCENGKYLASIIDDTVIMRDEIINTEAMSYDKETITNFTTNFNELLHQLL